jgi:hypothetical protein
VRALTVCITSPNPVIHYVAVPRLKGKIAS